MNGASEKGNIFDNFWLILPILIIVACSLLTYHKSSLKIGVMPRSIIFALNLKYSLEHIYISNGWRIRISIFSLSQQMMGLPYFGCKGRKGRNNFYGNYTMSCTNPLKGHGYTNQLFIPIIFGNIPF